MCWRRKGEGLGGFLQFGCWPGAAGWSGLCKKEIGVDVEAVGESPDVVNGEVAVAAEDHAAEVATAANEAGEAGGGHVVLVEEMLESLDARDFGPRNVLAIVIFEQGGEHFEVFVLAR